MMDMASKIAKLTEDDNKSSVARAAGLPANAINDLINKGNVPKVDKALRLARALDVPLDWLVDDEADFPVPDSPGKRIEDHSTDDLRLELIRRAHLLYMDCLRIVGQLTSVNWSDLARRAYDLPLGETDPEAEQILKQADALENKLFGIESMLDMQLEFDAYERGVARTVGRPAQPILAWREQLDQSFRGHAAYRALTELKSLRSTFTLPTMRDAAEQQRVSRLAELERMKLAQPASGKKAARLTDDA